jgi:hypothetical protein
MIELKRLAPQFRTLVTADFLVNKAAIDGSLATHVMEPEHQRKSDLEHLVNIVSKAIEKFSETKRGESDQWLAPRVHATLRLTRREAGDPGVWNYVGICVLEEYVRWRWQADTNAVAAERFVCGEYNKHAVARLWWGAELTRNGPDYMSTQLLFKNQDVQNSWVKTRLFRHRPTALASLRLLSTYNNGEFADSNTIRDLIKSFNMALTTTMLDAVAPSTDVDAQSVREWCAKPVDETTMYEDMPIGPDEPPVDEQHIEAVTDLLRRVVSKTHFTNRKHSAAA